MKPKYKEIFKLNKNLLIAGLIDFIVSAAVAQHLAGEEAYLNTTITLIVDFVTYFSVFLTLHVFDNRKKYKSNSKIDFSIIKADMVKILSSVGIGEVAYLSSRWLFQFHFLNIGIEAYQASVFAQIIAFVIFMVITNIAAKITKVY